MTNDMGIFSHFLDIKLETATTSSAKHHPKLSNLLMNLIGDILKGFIFGNAYLVDR